VLSRPCLLVALLLGLSATAASAASTHSHGHSNGMAKACKWNVTGTWTTTQGNDYHVTFRLKQSGTVLSGQGVLTAAEQAKAGYTTRAGNLTGSVKGSHLVLRVSWKVTATGQVRTGQYMGTLSKGKVVGSGRDITTPGAQSVSWSGTGPAKCSTASAVVYG
jgi:hypothetical protein